MDEPMVQVPVSVINRARAVVESEVDGEWVFRAQASLRALLSQPEPSAEPMGAAGGPCFPRDIDTSTIRDVTPPAVTE